jgi:hypothetical protein
MLKFKQNSQFETDRKGDYKSFKNSITCLMISMFNGFVNNTLHIKQYN